MTVYRQYTAEQLAVQYSPSSCVPDLRVELDAYAAASARTRAALEWRTLSYGPRPEERLDFFPAPAPAGPGGPGAPLVVFLHGGYWQELGRADASFPAAGLNSRGVAYAALGYGLAPRYGLDAIVAMVRKGARWLLAHAGELGCDPARMVLAGSSAGAHLAAMCLLDETPAAAPGQSAGWAGAVLLSGVYDLEPVRLTYVNDRVGMTRDEARRNSPLHHLPRTLPPLVLARGEHETDEFARQQQDFARAACSRTSRLVEVVATGRNHFDLCFDLADPSTALGRAVGEVTDSVRTGPHVYEEAT
ncbi:alpha/beta hydrolase [Kitasatospora sp. NBC_00085]|uniref:alpha/beta hydrolase n=1 Tax=unclassified Kitasatospora TaxID=2633591 RepID=UPI0032463C70